MKQLTLILISFFTIFALTNSKCKRDAPIPITPTVINSEFPNNIGTWWKYKVYDFYYLTTDTVTITVGDTTHLDNGTNVTIWKRASIINGIDSLYIDNKIDGIKIYQYKLPSAYPKKKYVFPLAIGNKWITQNYLDTNRVVLKSDTTIMGNNYINSYKIIRDTQIPPGLNAIIENEWFAPNIGTIYREFERYGQGAMEHYKMELINYHIN